MKILGLPLKGLHEIRLTPSTDLRGTFLKIWEKNAWENAGLPTQWSETYITKSNHRVLRGMHYQEPPAEHDKMVMVLDGEILDVALDIRRNSETYGKYFSTRMSDVMPTILFLPKGLAHGFLVLSSSATVIYQTTSSYCMEKDKGILWNSFGFPWPVTNPILSDRDQTHVCFGALESLFS